MREPSGSITKTAKSMTSYNGRTSYLKKSVRSKKTGKVIGGSESAKSPVEFLQVEFEVNQSEV